MLLHPKVRPGLKRERLGRLPRGVHKTEIEPSDFIENISFFKITRSWFVFLKGIGKAIPVTSREGP
jgi:hypothetical protein